MSERFFCTFSVWMTCCMQHPGGLRANQPELATSHVDGALMTYRYLCCILHCKMYVVLGIGYFILMVLGIGSHGAGHWFSWCWALGILC